MATQTQIVHLLRDDSKIGIWTPGKWKRLVVVLAEFKLSLKL